MNYQAICRVCTGENSRMVSIFEPYNFLANNCEIFKVIRDCASVQIQKFDGFSEQICPRCLDHLYQAYSFKKLCEDSDYKFRNDLIVSDKIEIKNEFSEEDAKILFEEIDNNITENISESSNVSEFRLTKVYSEQLEINPENKSEFDVNGIKQEELDSPCIFNDVVESVAYEEPFDLKNLQYIQDNTKEQYNYELKTQNNSNIEQIEREEEDDSTLYTAAFKSEDIKPFGLTLLYPENYKSSNRPYKCALCSKSVTSKRTLALHMKVHTRQQHICIICTAEFVRSTDLRHHMKIHSDSDIKLHSFQCTACNKTFTQNYASMQHMIEVMCDICRKKRPLAEQIQHMCDICGKKFKNKHVLKTHTNTHTEEMPYMCDVCGKKFKTKGILTTHIKSHTGEKPHGCEFCGKNFLHKGDLLRHIKLHTEENKYKCEICEKMFSRKENLTVHLKWHTGQRPYKCDICFKTFAYKCSLTAHLRIHTGEKQYACDICSANFTNKCSLVVHRRMHTGEKPYECDRCDKKFTSNGSLRKHIRVHTGETRYECDFCGKKFARRRSLVQHISLHMEKQYNCDISTKKELLEVT